MTATRLRVPSLAGMFALGLLGLALLTLPRGGISGLDRQGAGDAYGKLPLSFVPNAGQTDARARYYAQAGGRSFYFTDDKVVFALAGKDRGVALDLRFLGASPDAKLVAERQREGTVNYFGRSERHTSIPTYSQVRYRNLWPGVDLTFKGAAGALKYEFLVHPGARISDIGLAYAGASGLSLTDSGALRIETPLGPLTDAAPRSYQVVGGRRVAVDSRFRLDGKHAYGVAAGRYDHSRPLVIDPGLAYSTYLGGSANDAAHSIAVDENGNSYITGYTVSPNYPTTPGAFDTTLSDTSGAGGVIVTKLNSSGSSLVYSTFLEGSDHEQGDAIAVDDQGDAYVTGYTRSTDFPTTPGALDTTMGGFTSAFVTKLNATGSALLYSTYLGGSAGYTSGYGIALDDQGHATVVGGTEAADFPTTPGAFDTSQNGAADGFVTELNSTGTGLVFSTLLGGPGQDGLRGIVLDRQANAYVTGSGSASYPTTAGAYATTNTGGSDVVVTKLNSSGSGLLYSTFVGGSSTDIGFAIEIDTDGSAYVTGFAGQPFANPIIYYPTTPGAADSTLAGSQDGFVTKLDPTGGTLDYSTFLGGSTNEWAYGIEVDARGDAYVAGTTNSSDFPTTPNGFDTGYSGSPDEGFLTRLNRDGTAYRYSTYLGGTGSEDLKGLVLDSKGDVYVAGTTSSTNYPVTAGALDTTYNGGTFGDAVVTKLLGIGTPPYGTPQSADQLSASLVPTFRPCGTGGNPVNADHAPPLSVGSCTPPRPGGVAQVGSQATLSAVLTVVPGDHLSSNGDQADVTIAVSMSDITTSTNADYSPNPSGPDMTLYARFRFTDLRNGPAGGDPGTATDFDFPVPIDCTTTPSGSVGSTCSANTSADAVTPGLIEEDRSTILQTFRLRVNDSGLDGVRGTADDAIFATQGVFVP